MKMKVPFFDLVPQFVSLEKEIQSALGEVFKTQQFILGPQVKTLEQAICPIRRNPACHWGGLGFRCPPSLSHGFRHRGRR